VKCGGRGRGGRSCSVNGVQPSDLKEKKSSPTTETGRKRYCCENRGSSEGVSGRCRTRTSEFKEKIGPKTMVERR